MDRGISRARGVLMTDDFGAAAACRRHENLQSPELPFGYPRPRLFRRPADALNESQRVG